MMKKFNKILSLLMAFAMIVTMLPVSALAVEDDDSGITVERLDPSDVTANLVRPGGEIKESSANGVYADTDIVRVMIVLEGDPSIELMHNVEDAFSDGSEVADQRETLITIQHSVTDAISAAIGSELDVQWNLTLVANAISANVEFGQIEKIAAVAGVKDVFLEAVYMPLKADASNIFSQQMTGSLAVQNTGYTGAGTRIAVVDTGTDVDHQSFGGGAFEYALAELAAKKGMTYEEYAAELDLLTVEEIASVLDQLHIYSRNGGKLNAEDLYISSKLPFNYNYADLNLNVKHDEEDTSGGHGSHVAGIAAANRYVDCAKLFDFDGTGSFDRADIDSLLDFVMGGDKIRNVDYADLSGNGTITTYDIHLMLEVLEEYEANGAYYYSAFDTVHVTGVAPDAQLLTMKVFSSEGGTYASDYMAAVEDAIVLGCDVVNLSLGTASPGFDALYGSEWSEFVNGIMERIADSGIIMSTAAGNSGSWAAYSENGLGMTYADEAGTYTTGEPATYENTLSVASADNISGVSALEVGFWGANGRKIPVTPYSAVIDSQYLSTFSDMDDIDPDYAPTTYELVFLGDPSELFEGRTQTDMTIYAADPSDFDGYDFTGKVVLVARGGVGADGEGVYFSDKHTNAALAGAAAVVIYNNVPGAIQPSIDESDYDDVPCAGIAFEEALAIFNASKRNGQGLYAGSFTVCKRLEVEFGEDVQYPTMSSFSSWGATGDLRIKPEITAPGGSIYSVDGTGDFGNQYTIMSGTSMAAPHLSGLTALLNQYLEENGILEKTGMSARVLAQSLLMSTATPLIEEASGVEYSVRNQGAGLANIENAINSNAYILVSGQEDGKVKAELGDGTADRMVEFTITNFGDKALTYDLSASVLTTATAYYNGMYYSADLMTELDARVDFSTDRVTVAPGETVAVTATISVPESTVADMERIGYINGFYLEGFLYIDPIADSEGVMDAAHSIPMMGWYGDWSAPSMFDSGSIFEYIYNDVERPSHINSYMKNVLAWEPVGYGEGLIYIGNLYSSAYTETVYDEVTGAEIGIKYGVDGDQRYIEARNAISSLPTSWWNFYAIFPSLIRNVGDFKIEVTDAETGELYYVDDYEQYDDMMVSSYFNPNSGQWFDSTGAYGIGLDNWEFTDLNGEPLAEGTRIKISLTCVPEYIVENGKVDWSTIEQNENNTISYSFTIDNTFPELEEGSLVYDAEDKTLSFTVQDENYISAVVLLNGSASQTLGYYFPDMDEELRGTAVSGSLDLNDYEGRKVVIAVCDYAGNEVFYAINLGGEGASYGSMIGFQPDPNGIVGSWVAFDTNVNKNETALFMGSADFICAEYVNGHIYAQDENGKFYGIPYDAMLADSIDLESYYLTTLEYLYQDLAYSYAEGKLYGLCTEELYGSPQSYVNAINLGEPYYSEDMYEEIPTYGEEITPLMQDAAYGLTLACDEEGTLYMLAIKYEYDENWEIVPGETAHLWKAGLEEHTKGWGQYAETVIELAYSFTDLGDTGMKMDYLQSMTWDHNSGALYWARFYPVSLMEQQSELVKITIAEDDTFTMKVVGTLTNETCALMAPLTAETAAKDEYQNVPEFDASIIAVPDIVLDKTTLSKGSSSTLTCVYSPWYSDYKELIWTSSDETVAIVDQNGTVTAVGDGACVITAANAEDETLFDTCTVTVASLTLNIEGIISYSSGGINSVGGSKLYSYAMNNGAASMELGELITAPEEFTGYGLSIGAAIYAKGSIWACEFGNAGIVYEIDPMNGIIKDALSPIDGDMMFGFAYSETTGMFTGIMNYYMYVDQPLTHEAEEDMMNSYDPEKNQFTWNRLDLLEQLKAAENGFVTGETGQGASSEIVFCGITDIDNTDYSFYSVMGDDAFGGMLYASYTPVTTHVLLDNVGRLWYIDEIPNMTGYSDATYTELYDEMGGMVYTSSWGDTPSSVLTTVYHVDDDTDLYTAFVIREIQETPLTDMFREGTMPRITYHFSDIYYAGKTAEGAPVFYLSLYDYWNEGAENLLYLYVGSVGTGIYEWNEELWTEVELKTDPMLFELGGTGKGNIIASIFNATPAEEIEGLPAIEIPEPDYGYDDDSGWGDWSMAANFIGFYRYETSAATVTPVVPSISITPANIAAYVNRLG